MSIHLLSSTEVGLFVPPPLGDYSSFIDQEATLTLFSLSSHKRAKNAIDFGLSMRRQDSHIFLVGDDRSGRISATHS
ncbi:MAG TPA: hypothetical protein VI959_03780, partial [Alphaproteobacteria bacterium]|nr:hypothetical protein [Alphaproteobacteria bacterium]